MKLRWLLPAALVVLLLAACAPDSVSPGGGSSPTDAPSPSETVRTNDPYDY